MKTQKTPEESRRAAWSARLPECPTEKRDWIDAGARDNSFQTPEMGDKMRFAMLAVYGLEDLYYEPQGDAIIRNDVKEN